MALDYFFDNQIRRYWLQFIRIFNGFQYQTGLDASGNSSFLTVPVILASKDAQATQILLNNSDNVMQSVPQMSVWMTNIARAPERIQNPNQVRKINVWERAVDPVTNKYTSDPGLQYTVERFMPVPYNMTMQLDIWTSNELQKQQLIEQIIVLFNPSIDIQTGTNPIDWTSLTQVFLNDIQYSSRSFPQIDTTAIEVATLTFTVPIWISPPSKVKRQTIIQQIVTNILDAKLVEDKIGVGQGMEWSETELLSRLIVTPDDARVSVSGQNISLLNSNSVPEDANGNPLSWQKLFYQYGKFRPGISQLRLLNTDNPEDFTDSVVGTLQMDTNNPNNLIWTLNMSSLKANTMANVNAVINPKTAFPGGTLPVATEGQRYLLISDIGPDKIWGNVTARALDIIQYINGVWVVVFESSNHPVVEYLVNSTTGKQFKWTGDIWVLSIDGLYNEGFWRLYL